MSTSKNLKGSTKDIHSASSASVSDEDPSAETILDQTVNLNDQIQHKTLQMTGPKAPIIARPIFAILERHVKAEQSGDDDLSRKVELTGTTEKMQRAKNTLTDLFRIMQLPANYPKLQATFEFARRLEKAAPCKIFLKLTQNENTVTIGIEKLTAAERSPLAIALAGKAGLKSEKFGPWTQSDLKTKHETGVEFLITSNEGAKNIQQIGKTIAQNTPVNAAPTIITGLGVSPDFKI